MTKIELENKIKQLKTETKMNKLLTEKKIKEMQDKNFELTWALDMSNADKRQLKMLLIDARKHLIEVGFKIKKEVFNNIDKNNNFTSDKKTCLRFNDAQIEAPSFLYDFIMEFENMLKNNGGK